MLLFPIGSMTVQPPRSTASSRSRIAGSDCLRCVTGWQRYTRHPLGALSTCCMDFLPL